MRTLLRVGVVIVGAFGVAGGLSSALSGCGGDDTSVPSDSGLDVTLPDTAAPDSPVGADTGQDVSSGDALSETGADTGGDTGGDTGVDAGIPTVDQFPNAVTDALCTRLRECCQLQPAAWDQAACIASQNAAGGVKNLIFHAPALADGGAAKVQYDTAAAQTCLAYVRNVACTVSTADYTTIRTTCYAALKGTIVIGGTGCTDSIQCAAGRCDTSVDGGVCADFIGDGGLCESSDDCSYRGSYQPPLFCDDDPARHPDDAGGAIPTCSPQLGVGGNCGGSIGVVGDIEGACVTGICAGLGSCDTNFNQSPQGVCDAYTRPDAGIQDAATDG